LTLRIEALTRGNLEEAREVLRIACPWDRAAVVAEEKLFEPGASGAPGEALAAYEDGAMVGVACTSGGWLRLLAVRPTGRRRGVGTALLQECERQISAHTGSIRTMAQPGNYLSPGIDERNLETIAWLEKRGFVRTGSSCNLSVPLENNLALTPASYGQWQEKLSVLGYEVTSLSAERRSADIQTIADAFSPGWAFEIARASKGTLGGVFVAVEKDSGKLAGFAGHDGNNGGLGWFGPTGVLEEHRGKGLASALLVACLVDIRRAGHSHAEIAWIGPREFYQKVSGIDGERRFAILSKSIQNMATSEKEVNND